MSVISMYSDLTQASISLITSLSRSPSLFTIHSTVWDFKDITTVLNIYCGCLIVAFYRLWYLAVHVAHFPLLFTLLLFSLFLSVSLSVSLSSSLPLIYVDRKQNAHYYCRCSQWMRDCLYGRELVKRRRAERERCSIEGKEDSERDGQSEKQREYKATYERGFKHT
jgi:hypothetical protein